MAYYTGKDIEKSRGNAMKELILEKRSVTQVARRFGKKQVNYISLEKEVGETTNCTTRKSG